jgi:F-type H+-transporting ATPase subunit epsilon
MTVAVLFELELVTPQGILVHRSVRCVEAAGEDGRLGVLAGHQPYVVELAAGRTDIHGEDGACEAWQTGRGIMTIRPTRVTMLVQSAGRDL